MKTQIALSLLLVLPLGLFGKIKNGYESQLQKSYAGLLKFDSILKFNPNLSAAERRKIKHEMAVYENCILYYQLTKELLDQLRLVSPEIYNEIDTIKDKIGRTTDVCIKLIPKDQATTGLVGSTFLTQALNDKHESISEYGISSVSVRIWHIEGTLKVLCHELGHVKYIVPNLAAYIKFYRKQYGTPDVIPLDIGHCQLDKSGKIAWAFERKFRKDYAGYLKNHNTPLASFGRLEQKLRKSNQYREHAVFLYN